MFLGNWLHCDKQVSILTQLLKHANPSLSRFLISMHSSISSLILHKLCREQKDTRKEELTQPTSNLYNINATMWDSDKSLCIDSIYVSLVLWMGASEIF